MTKLQPLFQERVWGTTSLDPWFSPRELKGPVGEVWFETPDIPILVKFLFATDKLSVQVHPDDDYAALHHNSAGKTEMWHVLAAEPGATIAAGFRESITSDEARAAALSGDIVDLLAWHPAEAGDIFFIPAGTVHALGGGLTVCEIQQRSDITYRLFDFGRGRELHLDHALAVSALGPHEPRRKNPVSCRHFHSEALDVADSGGLPECASPSLLIAIAGCGCIAGQPMRAGDVWHLEGDSEPTEISGSLRLVRTFVPAA
jgi:mannose-6-phosphate isomerase